jgi:carbonic anhydrase
MTFQTPWQNTFMKTLSHLFANNHAWAERIKAADADFFQRLAHRQSPAYLWVGCSDSRVPPTELVGLSPGDMFEHRNVANVVVHTDLNCLSVIQYAVEVLAVKHIIVCGHYGCGGVQAALANSKLGLIDNWLRHVQDVRQKHARLLDSLKDDAERVRQLCELNVIEQVINVCQTTIVQQAWERGQELSVHGWLYGLEDGLLRNLNLCVTGQKEAADCYSAAIAAVARRYSL